MTQTQYKTLVSRIQNSTREMKDKWRTFSSAELHLENAQFSIDYIYSNQDLNLEQSNTILKLIKTYDTLSDSRSLSWDKEYELPKQFLEKEEDLIERLEKSTEKMIVDGEFFTMKDEAINELNDEDIETLTKETYLKEPIENLKLKEKQEKLKELKERFKDGSLLNIISCKCEYIENINKLSYEQTERIFDLTTNYDKILSNFRYLNFSSKTRL